MQPSTPQSVNSNSLSKVTALRQKQLFIPGVALVVLIIIVAILAWPSPGKKTNTQPDTATYANLDQASLIGKTASDHMHVQKPVELTSFSGQQGYQIVYKQFSKHNPIRAIADLEMGLVSLGPLTQQYKDNVGQNLTNSQSKLFGLQSQQFHKFVTDWLAPTYTVNFGNATSFTNQYIKTNAWQADYTAIVKAGAKQAEIYPALKGREVMLIGNSTVYYLMADAVNYNWDSNAKIWQQVFNSIQIDQP